MTLLAYILGLYVPFFSVDLSNVTLENIGTRFIVHFVVLTAVLIWICYMKGESPRWQWGKEK